MTRKKTTWRTWARSIVAAGVAALVVAAIGYGFVPKPQLVDVARVTRGPLTVTLDADGQTRVRNRFLVSAPVAGVVSRIELEPGDSVQRDDVLATIRPSRAALLDPQARAAAQASLSSAGDARRQAMASVERATALAELSEKNLARVERLAAGDAVPRQQLDDARADVRARQAELAALQAAVQVAAHQADSARAVLGLYRSGSVDTVPISSPTDGTVLRVAQESEAPVAAGTLLLEIANVRDLEIVVDLLSRDAASVRPGTLALIDGFAGAKQAPLLARVRRMDPAAFTDTSALGVREQRVNVVLDFIDAVPAGALGDAFAVDARFILFEAKDVLRVPLSALFRHGAGAGAGADAGFAVYVVSKDKERALLTPVALGAMSATDAEIVSGLAAGDVVILHPGDAVRANQRVKPRP